MAKIALNVNGKAQTVEAEPDTPLLYVLRDNLEMHGPKFGCGLGQCGAARRILSRVVALSRKEAA
jgi:nicotinate dehydrogenase subunit A